MANKIILKKSSVAAKVPLTTDLDYGELALNYADGKLYFKNASNVINSFIINELVVVNVTAASYNAVAAFGTTVILCNTSSNSVTVNLPTAVGNTAIYEIKKTNPANSMIIDAFSTETIDGDATITIVVENESLTLVSDNTNWKVI